jgi:hypothetical protein
MVQIDPRAAATVGPDSARNKLDASLQDLLDIIDSATAQPKTSGVITIDEWGFKIPDADHFNDQGYLVDKNNLFIGENTNTQTVKTVPSAVGVNANGFLVDATGNVIFEGATALKPAKAQFIDISVLKDRVYSSPELEAALQTFVSQISPRLRDGTLDPSNLLNDPAYQGVRQTLSDADQGRIDVLESAVRTMTNKDALKQQILDLPSSWPYRQVPVYTPAVDQALKDFTANLVPGLQSGAINPLAIRANAEYQRIAAILRNGSQAAMDELDRVIDDAIAGSTSAEQLKNTLLSIPSAWPGTSFGLQTETSRLKEIQADILGMSDNSETYKFIDDYYNSQISRIYQLLSATDRQALDQDELNINTADNVTDVWASSAADQYRFVPYNPPSSAPPPPPCPVGLSGAFWNEVQALINKVGDVINTFRNFASSLIILQKMKYQVLSALFKDGFDLSLNNTTKDIYDNEIINDNRDAFDVMFGRLGFNNYDLDPGFVSDEDKLFLGLEGKLEYISKVAQEQTRKFSNQLVGLEFKEADSTNSQYSAAKLPEPKENGEIPEDKRIIPPFMSPTISSFIIEGLAQRLSKGSEDLIDNSPLLKSLKWVKDTTNFVVDGKPVTVMVPVGDLVRNVFLPKPLDPSSVDSAKFTQYLADNYMNILDQHYIGSIIQIPPGTPRKDLIKPDLLNQSVQTFNDKLSSLISHLQTDLNSRLDDMFNDPSDDVSAITNLEMEVLFTIPQQIHAAQTAQTQPGDIFSNQGVNLQPELNNGKYRLADGLTNLPSPQTNPITEKDPPGILKTYRDIITAVKDFKDTIFGPANKPGVTVADILGYISQAEAAKDESVPGFNSFAKLTALGARAALDTAVTNVETAQIDLDFFANHLDASKLKPIGTIDPLSVLANNASKINELAVVDPNTIQILRNKDSDVQNTKIFFDRVKSFFDTIQAAAHPTLPASPSVDSIIAAYNNPAAASGLSELNTINPQARADLADAMTKAGNIESALVTFKNGLINPNDGKILSGVDPLTAVADYTSEINTMKGAYTSAPNKIQTLLDANDALQANPTDTSLKNALIAAIEDVASNNEASDVGQTNLCKLQNATDTAYNTLSGGKALTGPGSIQEDLDNKTAILRQAIINIPTNVNILAYIQKAVATAAGTLDTEQEDRKTKYDKAVIEAQTRLQNGGTIPGSSPSVTTIGITEMEDTKAAKTAQLEALRRDRPDLALLKEKQEFDQMSADLLKNVQSVWDLKNRQYTITNVDIPAQEKIISDAQSAISAVNNNMGLPSEDITVYNARIAYQTSIDTVNDFNSVDNAGDEASLRSAFSNLITASTISSIAPNEWSALSSLINQSNPSASFAELSAAADNLGQALANYKTAKHDAYLSEDDVAPKDGYPDGAKPNFIARKQAEIGAANARILSLEIERGGPGDPGPGNQFDPTPISGIISSLENDQPRLKTGIKTQATDYSNLFETLTDSHVTYNGPAEAPTSVTVSDPTLQLTAVVRDGYGNIVAQGTVNAQYAEGLEDKIRRDFDGYKFDNTKKLGDVGYDDYTGSVLDLMQRTNPGLWTSLYQNGGFKPVYKQSLEDAGNLIGVVAQGQHSLVNDTTDIFYQRLVAMGPVYSEAEYNKILASQGQAAADAYHTDFHNDTINNELDTDFDFNVYNSLSGQAKVDYWTRHHDDIIVGSYDTPKMTSIRQLVLMMMFFSISEAGDWDEEQSEQNVTAYAAE